MEDPPPAAAAAAGKKRKKHKDEYIQSILVRMKDGLVYRMSKNSKALSRDCRGAGISRLHLAGVDPEYYKTPPLSVLPLHLLPAVAAITSDNCVHFKLLEDRGVLQRNFPHARCRHTSKLYPKLKRLHHVCEDCIPAWVGSRKCFGGVWHLVAEAVKSDALPASAVPSPLWPLFRASVSRCEEPWTEPIAVAAEGSLAPTDEINIEAMMINLPVHIAEIYLQLAHDLEYDTETDFAKSLWRLCGSNELGTSVMSPSDQLLAEHIAGQPGSVYHFDPMSNRLVRTEWQAFADVLIANQVLLSAPTVPPEISYERIFRAEQLAKAAAEIAQADPSALAHVHIMAASDITVGDISALITASACRVALTFEPTVKHIAHYIHSLALL